jgi:hypothetical protein
LKSFRIVDFVSGFRLIIDSKVEIHTFNNNYESQYKINGPKTLRTNFLVRRAADLPELLFKIVGFVNDVYVVLQMLCFNWDNDFLLIVKF